MDVDCTPNSSVSHGRLMTSPHRVRTTQSSPARYSFSYNELYQLLYLQREVENVKLEDLKTISQPGSPDKKGALKNKDPLVSCETCRGHPKAECTEHGTPVFTRKSKPKELQFTYAVSSFPDEVQLCWSGIPGAGYGVSAKQHIPIGTWIGPYEGRRIRPEDFTKEMDTSYMWEIFQDGRLVCYLDASDENTSSWMRFIRCARHRDEQNLYAFQYCGNIYYRAFRNIQVQQELLVWYDDKYQQHMGLPLNIQDMAVVDPNGNKLLFDLMACSVKPPIKEQHPVTQSTSHVTQATPVAISKHSPKGVAPSGLAKRYHVSTHASHSVTKAPVQRVTPVTQHQIKETHCQPANVTQPILVSCTTRYPIVVTAPVSTVVMETGSEKLKNEGTIRKIPISVTHNSSVTPSTYPVKQMSPSKRKKLHDQHVTKPEVKHLKTHSGNTYQDQLSAVQYGNAIEHIVGSDIPEDDEDASDRSMWNCGQCQRSFTQRALLQIHVCQGMPNRPYKCGHCADSFAQPNDLRTHVVKHTNEKPFKCGYCSRSFAGATTLNNHIRTHTGEKPFICNKCRKMFSTASQLSRHQKTPSECT